MSTGVNYGSENNEIWKYFSVPRLIMTGNCVNENELKSKKSLIYVELSK
jgi:hypothetical protein